MSTILANISPHLPPINLNLHNLNKVVLKKVELYTPGYIPIFRCIIAVPLHFQLSPKL